MGIIKLKKENKNMNCNYAIFNEIFFNVFMKEELINIIITEIDNIKIENIDIRRE